MSQPRICALILIKAVADQIYRLRLLRTHDRRKIFMK